MDSSPVADLDPPRFATIESLLLAGLVERYNNSSSTRIPDQWRRFLPYFATIPGQLGKATYGAIYHFDGDGNFDYLCGVEVGRADHLPDGITSLHVRSQKFAVFTHRGHLSGIRATMAAIFRKGIPDSGSQVDETGPTLERYGPEFDPRTGLGGFEIWVPVQVDG